MTPTTTAALRICIVNGYPKASRENFDRSDVGHPHDLFKDFLQREAPNATSDIVYVADPDFLSSPRYDHRGLRRIHLDRVRPHRVPP